MKRKRRRLKIKVRKVVKKLGRPSLYPQGTEMSVLRSPKHLKETLQAIAVHLTWGRLEEAKQVINKLGEDKNDN